MRHLVVSPCQTAMPRCGHFILQVIPKENARDLGSMKTKLQRRRYKSPQQFYDVSPHPTQLPPSSQYQFTLLCSFVLYITACFYIFAQRHAPGSGWAPLVLQQRD